MTSPKQPQSEQKRDWYPYYAGFTRGFVESVLTEVGGEAESILDPWNGSGTTTAACASRRLTACGMDISPALTVVARARLTPSSVADSLAPLAAEIIEAARREEDRLTSDDLLTNWVRPSAAARIRRLQSAIHTVLESDPEESRGLRLAPLADGLPLLACFYYCALFAATRDLLVRFRASNPTWVKDPKTPQRRVAPSWHQLATVFVNRVEYLCERLAVPSEPDDEAAISIRTGTASELPFDAGAFDACITSPPYATRIDYVRGVLPELALLRARNADIEDLRAKSTGSPVVRGVEPDSQELDSPYGRLILERIAAHDSKGSKNYYFPWMANYFNGLQRGLREIARVVSDSGPVCIVVQDSHYKELRIHLQRVVIEIMRSAGRVLAARRDFEAKHHRAHMNPRARLHLERRRASESLLIFN